MQSLLGTRDRPGALLDGCATADFSQSKNVYFLPAVALTPGEAGGDVWGGDMDLCG